MRRPLSPMLSMSKHSTTNLLTLVLCLLIFSTLSFAAAPDRITGPIVAGQLIRLSGGVPMQAQAKYDQGPVDPSLKLSYMTLLTVPSASQQKAITKLLAQQQDPSSPQYHKWLTPEQYADRFGLSVNDINKITAWLQSQGFAIVRTARARNFVVFSGTAAQVEKTFQTEIHSFDVDGQMHFSNTTPPLIPAALSGIVTGFHGFNNFRPKSQAKRGDPAYTFVNGGLDNYFLAPGDIATIYDVNPLGVDGTGQKLAVIGQTGIYQSDLTNFRQNFQLSAISCTTTTDIITACNTSNFVYTLVNGTATTIYDGDLPEADLDVEWSGATARNAQVIFVTATDPNGDGVWDSWYYAVDNTVAPVITMSYTAPCELAEAEFSATNPGPGIEGTFTSDEAELQAANLAGITFMNSAGDTGAAECDYGANVAVYGYAAAYPASSQYVTAVGGTSIPKISPNEYSSTYWNTANGSAGSSAKSYIPEQPWNDAQEFGLECAAAPTSSFCEFYGITDWPSAQAALGISAGGGGVSNCVKIDTNGVCTAGFPQPSWQSGISASAINPSGFGVTSTPARYTPDVSLLASANFPGYLICTQEAALGGPGSGSVCDSASTGITDMLNACFARTGPCAIYGGTSVSSPVFAGMVTLLNQYLGAKGGLGNINSTLYTLAKANSTNHAFNHVTTGSTGSYSDGAWCQEGTPTSGVTADPWPTALQCPSSGANAGFLGFNAYNADTATGYNLVTGLGSVDVHNLGVAWAALLVGATTTTVTSSQNPAFENSPVTFTATVTTTGSHPPTGTVTFNDGTTDIGSGTLSTVSGSQVATFTTSALAVGSHSITAVYAGDANNGGSTSAVLTQTIAALPTTSTALTSSSNPANYAAAVTFTATVTTTGSHAPTGSVLLNDGTTNLGGSNLNGAEFATFTISTLTVGSHSITAVYSGDTNNEGSTSAVLTQVITAPTFTFSTEPTTPAAVPAGVSTTSNFAVTPTGTTNVPITFVCNLPSGIVGVGCAFNPTQIAAGASGAQPVTLTITTAGPNTAGGIKNLRRRADNRSPLLPFALPLAGIVMVGFAGRKMSKYSVIAALCASLVLLGLLVACGSSNAPPVGISVSPAGSTVWASGPTGGNWPPQTASFSATVTNASNTGVTWTCSLTPCGFSSTTTSPTTYTAPTVAAGLPTSVTITATSQADSTKVATATVTITPTTVPTSIVGAPYSITVTATEGPTSNPSSALALTVQ